MLKFRNPSRESYPEAKFGGFTYQLKKAGLEWWLTKTRDPLTVDLHHSDASAACEEASAYLCAEFGVQDVTFVKALWNHDLWQASIESVGTAYVTPERRLTVSFNTVFVLGPYRSFYELRTDATTWLNELAAG